MTHPRKRTIWLALATLLVVIGLIVAEQSLPLGDWLESLNEWTSTRGTFGLLVYGMAYAAGVVLLLPSSVFTMSAGIAYGLTFGTLISLLGATTGATIAFAIARCCGRAHVQRWLQHHRKLKAIDQAIAEHQWKIIFLLRLAPIVPFAPTNYSLGLSNVRFWPYLTATFAGLIPGTFLYTYAGYAGYAFFGDNDHSTMQYLLIAVGLLFAIAVAVTLGQIAKKALKKIEREQGTG